ncbi:MAG: hypothetical protein VYA59_00440 [Pseudomonadota bacterium]|nr:hypothetical protein [Pseudomonadota bacterium]
MSDWSAIHLFTLALVAVSFFLQRCALLLKLKRRGEGRNESGATVLRKLNTVTHLTQRAAVSVILVRFSA